MRVLLIRPPARHTVESEVPEAVEAENLSYPPLALLALASFLRDHSDHPCALLDAQLEDLEYSVLEDRIRAEAPDVVGITCFTVQLSDVMRTIEAARSAGVQYVVLGGPHINDFPKESLALEGVDAAQRLLLLGGGTARAALAGLPHLTPHLTPHLARKLADEPSPGIAVRSPLLRLHGSVLRLHGPVLRLRGLA